MDFNKYEAPDGFMYKEKNGEVITKIVLINKKLNIEEYYQIIKYKEEA